MNLSTLMKGKFRDQGKLDQELEEWLSQIGIKPSHGFFSEKYKQESTQIEGLAPEVETISNQYLEEEISTMVIFKWSDVI